MAKRQTDPLRHHKSLLAAEASGWRSFSYMHFHDVVCHINYNGRIFRGFLVGYSENKPTEKYLLFSRDIINGHYGEGYDLNGLQFKGFFNNHVWCSPSKDMLDLLKTPNSFVIISDHLLRRSTPLNLDVCTFETICKKFNIDNRAGYVDPERIRSKLFDFFCKELKLEDIRPVARKLEIEE